MKTAIAGLIISLSLTAYAHEGHDTPGALPPPPNGGRLAELKHDGDDKHAHGAGEAEVFLEGKVEGSKLRIFAHELNGKSFKTLNPGAELKLDKLEVEAPRSKKKINASAKTNANGWEADISALKERRFVVRATLMAGNERKSATIQVEK